MALCKITNVTQCLKSFRDHVRHDTVYLWYYGSRCVFCSVLLYCVFWQACYQLDVQCIVAPYEADAQLAYLQQAGIVDMVISEDSDLLTYGCTKVSASWKVCHLLNMHLTSASDGLVALLVIRWWSSSFGFYRSWLYDSLCRHSSLVSPSIAQLVERKTVGAHYLGCAAIFRSLVQIRLEGFFFNFSSSWTCAFLCGLCSKNCCICISFDSSVGRAEDCRSTSSGMCSHL